MSKPARFWFCPVSFKDKTGHEAELNDGHGTGGRSVYCGWFAEGRMLLEPVEPWLVVRGGMPHGLGYSPHFHDFRTFPPCPLPNILGSLLSDDDPSTSDPDLLRLRDVLRRFILQAVATGAEDTEPLAVRYDRLLLTHGGISGVVKREFEPLFPPRGVSYE